MKRAVSEKRTQVYFPEALYAKVQKRAREESKSMAEVVREAVERYLVEKQIDWENDSLFKLIGLGDSGIDDLSVNHDKYLYGTERQKPKG